VKGRVQLLQGKMRDSDVISAVAVAVAPTLNKVQKSGFGRVGEIVCCGGVKLQPQCRC
jgi:hypothetical protein